VIAAATCWVEPFFVASPVRIIAIAPGLSPLRSLAVTRAVAEDLPSRDVRRASAIGFGSYLVMADV
jgi:hypothetical protein